jgi:hypothetical protein
MILFAMVEEGAEPLYRNALFAFESGRAKIN